MERIEKVILFGAGEFCKRYIERMGNEVEILAIADNNIKTDFVYGHKVIEANEIPTYDYDKVVICLNDYSHVTSLKATDDIINQLMELGIPDNCIKLQNVYYSKDDSRVSFLEEYARSVEKCKLEGAVAECGVYRGHFVHYINKLLSKHTLYLFDTFCGFDAKDIEEELSFSSEKTQKNIYECDLSYGEKQQILNALISSLKKLHQLEAVQADTFSMKEAYFNKTIERISKIEDLVPFARDKEIKINGRKCRNVFYHKRELETKLEKLKCEYFSFIHGDCTFSNLMLRENGAPVLIDPRGYFGYTELYGDVRYDWAKLYYSIVGNYDRFNLKEFKLQIGENSEEGVQLEIESNHWEDMERDFFALTGADEEEIKLLHAVIWLSLTTYAWQDYDSICGAFYNGLYYLEEIL